MSSQAAPAPTPTPKHSRPSPDPLGAQVIGLATLATALLLILGGQTEIRRAISQNGGGLAFWTLVVLVIDLFPVSVHQVRLTLDMPVLLAVAILHPPPVASALAFVAAMDLREFRGEVSFLRAMFNRAQIALSIYLASMVFAAIADSPMSWPRAAVAAVVAVLVDYGANLFLVSMHLANLRKISPVQAMRMFHVGSRWQFLLTYLGSGVLGSLLAVLYLLVGAWAVGVFLIPLLVARQSLARAHFLESVSGELRDRESLLQSSLARLVDERRDERLRIAGQLHDSVLQCLVELWFLGKQVVRGTAQDYSRFQAHASNMVVTVERAMESLRETIHDLRDSPLGGQGLVPVLERLLQDLRLEWQRRITFAADFEEVPCSERVQLTVYQVAREALLNALRHSTASVISVHLSAGRGFMQLQVKDDGVGFDSGTVDPRAHFGLALARERLGQIGGSLRVVSGPGLGTRLLATAPTDTGDEELGRSLVTPSNGLRQPAREPLES